MNKERKDVELSSEELEKVSGGCDHLEEELAARSLSYRPRR